VSRRRSSRHPLVRPFYALLCAGLLAYAAYTLGVGKPDLQDEAGELYLALMYGAAAGAVGSAIVRRQERLAWAALATSFILVATGDTVWDHLYTDVAEPPFPNWSDAFYLASYPMQYAGVLLLLKARLHAVRRSLWLDGAVGGLVVAAVGIAVLFPVVLRVTEGHASTVAVTLAYPLLDCLTLSLVALAAAVWDWKPGRQWTLLGLGLILTALADAVFTYQASVGSYDDESLVNALWPAGALSMSLAAWQAVPRRRVVDTGWRTAAMTVAFTAVALALLGWGQLRELTATAGLFAVAAVVVFVVRAGLTLRENGRILAASEEHAVTDALSGLPNRRQLLTDLADCCEEGRPSTLAFFDLDGFKTYNDAFGHGAGDALLARLGAELARVLAPHGCAYRLGGDEFCALFDRPLGRDDEIVTAAAAALTEQGERFTVGVSYGVVALPTEAHTAEAALRLADERMYAHKHAERSGGRGQVMDALLAALHEREPDLGAHHGHVAELAADVARELGCDSETVDETARAAALHDIGKVAIPDAILHKPGALDDDEWAYMRQHTVVGERILLAAPALRPVATIVRSSHERWDGGGYPDELAGAAIPLPARIVAVCDAYDAMREDRTYSPPMDQRDALAELRRCAGTQFDPDVVAAFLRCVDAPVLTAAGARTVASDS